MSPEEAFDLYYAAIYRFAYRMSRRAQTAEDIAQECFFAFLRNPERHDAARATVRTYLFSIARNLALKQYRDSHGEVQLDDSQPTPQASNGLAPDLSAAVEQAVGRLPPLQQEALVLFEYEGFTLEEIAQMAGADVGTVKSRLHRARERLKRTLAPYRSIGETHGTT